MIAANLPVAGLCMVLVTIGYSSAGLAQSVEGEIGQSALERTILSEEALEDGRRALSRHSSGIFYTDDPDLPFNNARYDCFASFIVDADGQGSNGHGHCMGVDPDDNVWWVAIRGRRNGGSWTFIDGTGIYKGSTGAGSWTAKPTAGEDLYVTTWTGTWTLKAP